MNQWAVTSLDGRSIRVVSSINLRLMIYTFSHGRVHGGMDLFSLWAFFGIKCASGVSIIAKYIYGLSGLNYFSKVAHKSDQSL